MFVDYAEEVEFGKDQEVIKEGDGSGDETMYFYIVKSGRCKFTQKGQGDIGGCGPGDSFGELALLSNCPRAATVTATEKCKMYQVDRSTFRFMMKEAAIHQTEEVMEFLQKLDILANLDDAQMEVVASAVIAQDFRAGEKVFSEGDEGNIFYMIQSGSVAVRTIKPGMDDVRIMAGNYFGDAALTTGEARNATIECVEPCRLLLLSREDFDKVSASVGEKFDAKHNERMINSVEFLSTIKKADRDHLMEQMEEKEYSPETTILDERKEDSKFYIIKSGEVSMNSAGASKEIQTLMAGDYFNIQTLLPSGDGERLWPTCIAKDKVTCFVFEREVMMKVAKMQSLAKDAYDARMNMIAAAKQKKIPFKQLKVVAPLGQGSFGRVKLVQDKKNKKNIFALKSLHKEEIVRYAQQTNTLNEKNIMMVCNHPFILQLHNTYKDSHRLYFLLEFCNGGELFSRLHTTTKDGCDEKRDAKFYCGCVAHALSYMLDRNIMYRDLKPENMLIDEGGYIKVGVRC
jgi:CRP-like cAMP-binding protein